MCPQAAKDEVAALVKRGLVVELVEVAGQCYVLERGVTAPVPPWDRGSYDILVAIPAAYDACSLDAFYLALPYKFNGGDHPRVNGGTNQLRRAAMAACLLALPGWQAVDAGPG